MQFEHFELVRGQRTHNFFLKKVVTFDFSVEEHEIKANSFIVNSAVQCVPNTKC